MTPTGTSQKLSSQDKRFSQQERRGNGPHNSQQSQKKKNPLGKCRDYMKKVTEHMQKLEKEIHTQKRPNLSKKERAALDLLKKDANIVIKKADKDGALVVLKTESYIKMGNQHLRDKETYETVGNPEEALQAVTRESKLLVNRFHTLDNIKEKVRSFTAGQRDALLQHKASIPHWYVLPKTHKAIDEDTGTWPGRPVLSGCSAPTRPVDRLLTTFLTPLLELLPERLQDTSDFLRKMKDSPRFPKDSIIFSFDIVSLYPSIPQEEAAWVVANFYEKNYGYVQGRLAADFNITPPPPYLIKEGIDHVLRGTLLRFDNKFYRQCKGTAIGASVSVALAEIFVHVSIEKKRKKLRKQPEIFYRYIDDIFGIFTGTEEELQQYHKELNELHPDLKFTLEWSKEKLPFLDTMVYWDTEMRPQTSTFYKPSNTHQYLHFLSSHHPSLKKSLPFSQGIRIKRIISERKNLDKALQEMPLNLVSITSPSINIEETRDNRSRKDPQFPSATTPKPPLLRFHPLIYTACLSPLSLTFFFASGPPLLRNSSCDRASQNQPTSPALTKCSPLRGLLLVPPFSPHTGTPGGKGPLAVVGGNRRLPFRVPCV
ncbi:hypothetical protein C7M84_019632 [Penaeus vannamei]|uniref:Reverse transcriptase domain-containing protein n=1 Tax=Penaeus vannamei TaxID=6689 RepID=A0A3R7LYM8_PENVA|nr:hypothetical protein C7M84_019632 [Penaeus vannamei]